MSTTFRKAVRESLPVRMAIYGPSGSGKTYSALAIASGLASKIALIDTEHGKSRLYSDRFSFDVCDLPPDARSLDDYEHALREAANAGYEVVVIDSLSHAWQWVIDQVDIIAKANKGNSFSPWAQMTPRQREFIDFILRYPGHVIATMRSKTEWAVENNGGKNKPVKMGLAPEQGKGIEYEFDLLCSITPEHVLAFEKDRTGQFQDRVIDKPTAELGKAIAAWFASGKTPEPKPATPTPAKQPLPSAGNGAESARYKQFIAETKGFFASRGISSADGNDIFSSAVKQAGTTHHSIKQSNDGDMFDRLEQLIFAAVEMQGNPLAEQPEPEAEPEEQETITI